MTRNMDCVIIGYNDSDLGEQVESLYKMREYSGGYQNVLTNTVGIDGERHTYMSLLNRSLIEARSKIRVEEDLHVAKMPNLGAWYLHNYLSKNGYSVDVVNSFNHDKQQLNELLSGDVRTIAITTTFYLDYKPIREIVDYIRERNNEAKVIVGGPYIYNTWEAYETDTETLSMVMQNTGADAFVVDSQGELTLTRVVSHFRGDKFANETYVEASEGKLKSNSLISVAGADAISTESLSSIPNIMYFEESKLVITPRQAESNDMNKFSIDYSILPEKNFSPVATTRTARSCAFKCAFCRYPIMAGPLNLVDIEVMKEQFDEFERSGVKYVVIIDDTFNVPLPRFKHLCKMIIENGYSFKWFSYFRASNSDYECFDLMHKSNCGGVFLGIESGDQSILNNMNKTATVKKYVRAIQELNKRNIITFASIIVGFPGETSETIENTIRFIEEAKPRYWRAELYYHMHKTPITERAEEFGIRGAGYSWSHNSMDWREASDKVNYMYSRVKDSTILPLYMFDFWCIPYLLGCGITKEQFHRFVTTSQEILLSEINDDAINVDSYLDMLADIFREDSCVIA